MTQIQATFVLSSYNDQSKLHTFLNQHIDNAKEDKKPLVVRVSQKQEKRSNAQNRLMWKWYQEIENETGQSQDSIHFEMKKKFLIYILRRDDVEYAALCYALSELKESESEQYEAIAVGVIKETSTTKLNTTQFTEYLQRIEAYVLSQMGIKLTVPDDLMWVID